eukprot:4746209-Pyramimonas_sp.AAC.1
MSEGWTRRGMQGHAEGGARMRRKKRRRTEGEEQDSRRLRRLLIMSSKGDEPGTPDPGVVVSGLCCAWPARAGRLPPSLSEAERVASSIWLPGRAGEKGCARMAQLGLPLQ